MKKYILSLTLLFLSAITFAQSKSFVLKVSGEVTKPLQLSLSDIDAMQHHTADLKDRDGKPHPYSGVAVQDILAKAGATVGKELKGENLTKYLLVKCADGYQVIFSLAELDSSFTDKTIILADGVEGKPLPESKGPLRIVVPDTKKPARSCQQVVEFVVGYAKD